MNNNEVFDDGPDDYGFGFGGGGSGDSADVPNGETSNVDLFDPAFFGLDQTPLGVVLGGAEADLSGASDVSEKLALTAQQNLSNSRRQRKEKGLERITAEDFEAGPERDAYIIIETNKNWLFGHSATYESQRKAIDFFFTLEDNGSATFELCCQALFARKDLIRLRVHYEFWLRWIVFKQEFPFMTVPLPGILEGEVVYHAGPEGIELASEAWLRPGIPQSELLMYASGADTLDKVPQKYLSALQVLEDRFILSEKNETWYITGRNPLLRRLQIDKETGRPGGSATVSWSKLWGTASMM